MTTPETADHIGDADGMIDHPPECVCTKIGPYDGHSGVVAHRSGPPPIWVNAACPVHGHKAAPASQHDAVNRALCRVLALSNPSRPATGAMDRMAEIYEIAREARHARPPSTEGATGTRNMSDTVNVPPRVLEAIAHNLCSLHDFDQAWVVGQERFAKAVITEYLRASPSTEGDGGWWRDISSAPKDGSGVIAFVPGFGMGSMVLSWFDGYWREPVNCLGLKVPPTHWCPLPTSPQPQEQSR